MVNKPDLHISNYFLEDSVGTHRASACGFVVNLGHAKFL